MSNTQEVGLIIVGNSGVGKSFLANILLQKEQFRHELSPTAVTKETELETVNLQGANGNAIRAAIFNIPGLIDNDQEAIEKNKREIDKAFQLRPVSIIVYVFGVVGGRIRDEDIVAFKALDVAYKINRDSLCFVVNDLPPPGPERSTDYEGQTVALLKALLKIDNPRVAFCDRLVPKTDPAGRARILANLCEVIVKCVPKHHKKEKEIMLRADEILKLKKRNKKPTRSVQKTD